MNSLTVPETCTLLPITAPAGRELPVKTKMPSEVVALPSPVGSWMKKPPLEPALMPVTMPEVVTVCVANGEVLPLP